MRLFKAICYVLLLTSFIGHTCLSDIIHLKNGRNIKCDIKRETASSVIVEVEIGKMAVSKSDIDHIEKRPYEKKDQVKHGTPLDLTDPSIDTELSKKIEGMYKMLSEVRRNRNEARKFKSRYDSHTYKVANIERELSSISVRYENLNARIRRRSSGGKKKDVFEYNRLISESNELIARKEKLYLQIKDSIKMKERLGPKASASLSYYSSSIQEFEEALKKECEDARKKGVNKNEEACLKGLENELSKLKKDFKRIEVDVKSIGNSIFVDVLLNNRVKTRMLVDTGASVLLISRKTADKLKVYEAFGARKKRYKVADGRTIEATPVVLHSVEVGGMVVKNVPASIFEGRQITELLGMSFLGNFLVRVDLKSKKLILDEFKAL